MKNAKRFTALLLALIMVLSCAPVSIFAVENGTAGNGAVTLTPIADTYVSADDDTAHGSDTTLDLTNGNIALLTYKKPASGYGVIELNIPVTEGSVTADIYLVDGLSVAGVESTLIYSEYEAEYASKIDDNGKLGNYKLSKGDNYIDITAKVNDFNGDNFTLVIKPTRGEKYTYNFNFSDEMTVTGTETDITAADYFCIDNTENSSTLHYSTEKLGSIPVEPYAIRLSTYGYFFNATTYKTGIFVMRLFNTISNKPLVKVDTNNDGTYDEVWECDDSGNKVRNITGWEYTFTVKCHSNSKTTARDMTINVVSSDGTNTYKESETLSCLGYGDTNKDIPHTFTYTLDPNHVIVDENGDTISAPMFALDFVDNTTRYITEVSVTGSNPNTDVESATLASKDGAAYNAPYIKTSNAGDLVAATYVSGAYPDAAFGLSDKLFLNGGENEHIILATFRSRTLNKDDFISLPISNQSLVTADVYLLDDYRVNERATTYNDIISKLTEETTLIKNCEFTRGQNLIDLSTAAVTGDYFTIAIKSTDENAYVPLTQGFDSLEADRELILNSTPPTGEAANGVTPYYSCTTSNENVYNYLGAVRGSLDKVGYTRALSDGNTIMEINTSSKGYLVFYNSVSRYDVIKDGNTVKTFNDEGDTVDITNKKLRITADVATVYDPDVSNSLICNVKYVAYAPKGGSAFFLGESSKADKDANDVRLSEDNNNLTLSYDYDISAEHIDISYDPYSVDSILGFHFNNANRTIHLDNIRVCEVVDGNEVQAVIAKDSIILDNLIDDHTVAITATVSQSNTNSDLITIVDGETTHVLLRADENGNLTFDTEDTKNIVLYGYDTTTKEYVPYNLTNTDTDLKVVAIYDDTNGTVRFAVGDRLACYYDENNDIKPTYGHVVVTTAGGVGDTAYVDGIEDITRIKAPKIIGTQTHSFYDSVRFVAGVDSTYYSSVGFKIEVPGKTPGDDPEDPETKIFSSIVANGAEVKAADYGYNYFSALALEGVNSSSVVKVTPYVKVGDNPIYGEEVYYSITVDTENNNAITVKETTADEFNN